MRCAPTTSCRTSRATARPWRKTRDDCCHLGCILPRVPAIIVRTGRSRVTAGRSPTPPTTRGGGASPRPTARCAAATAQPCVCACSKRLFDPPETELRLRAGPVPDHANGGHGEPGDAAAPPRRHRPDLPEDKSDDAALHRLPSIQPDARAGHYVSRHDIAAVWAAFFSRWQRYRC